MDTLTDYDDVVLEVLQGLRRRSEIGHRGGSPTQSTIWDPGLVCRRTNKISKSCNGSSA